MYSWEVWDQETGDDVTSWRFQEKCFKSLESAIRSAERYVDSHPSIGRASIVILDEDRKFGATPVAQHLYRSPSARWLRHREVDPEGLEEPESHRLQDLVGFLLREGEESNV